MSEISAASIDSGATKATPSPSEQARKRKERREAKIRAGGSARLNRITGLGGGLQRDLASQSTLNIDSDNIETSSHYYKPANVRIPSDENYSAPHITAQHDDDILNQIKTHELDLMSAASNNNSRPLDFAYDGISPAFNSSGAEDPMMKILQKVMGGINGEGPQNIPSMPDLKNLKPTPISPKVQIWRIIHALFALSLGLHIAVTTKFTGSVVEREDHPISYDYVDGTSLSVNQNYFYIFVTVEALLISTRHLINREEVELGGFGGIILNFLNEPYRSYLQFVMRHIDVWTTVSRDAMVCIFVLGAYAWWNDSAA